MSDVRGYGGSAAVPQDDSTVGSLLNIIKEQAAKLINHNTIISDAILGGNPAQPNGIAPTSVSLDSRLREIRQMLTTAIVEAERSQKGLGI